MVEKEAVYSAVSAILEIMARITELKIKYIHVCIYVLYVLHV